jgi:hypothetical protein
VDPFAVLGLERGASSEQVTAAYRRLAKRWHPDHAHGFDAARRMAQINEAYGLLREGTWRPSAARTAAVRPRSRAVAGAWLPEPVRRALGRELLDALQAGEDVPFVVPAATWASPRALLAVTDRRLLWLLDDAVSDRVRRLRFSDIAEVEHRLAWPRRRQAVLRIRRTNGRRLGFAELPPSTAEAIARHITLALAAAS